LTLDPYGCVGGLTSLPQYALRLQLESSMVRSNIPLDVGSALDFGCGYGRLTYVLAEACVEVHGIDNDVEKIKVANEIYSKTPWLDVWFDLLTERRLPYPDKSFDLSLAVTVFQHLTPEDQKYYAEELRRVTKKHILIVDWSVDCERLFGSTGDFAIASKRPRALGGSFDFDWVPGDVYLYSAVTS